MTLALVGGAVLIGALTQRATGMGFALVASPLLVLALGPVDGVVVTNVCSVLAAGVTIPGVWRSIDWSRARWLVPAGLIGILPGAFAVRRLPDDALGVAVSAVVLVALAATVLGRSVRVPASPVVAGVGGVASGFMNVTAGVGGPGIAVYAVATRWPHASFAATAQVQFLVLGLASLAAKGTWPALGGGGWAAVAVALPVGLACGTWIARRVEGRRAMTVVIVVAACGACATMVRSLVG